MKKIIKFTFMICYITNYGISIINIFCSFKKKKKKEESSTFLSQCKMKTDFEKFHVFLMEEKVCLFLVLYGRCAGVLG